MCTVRRELSRTITQIVVAKDIQCFANVPILRLKSDVFHNERRPKHEDELLLAFSLEAASLCTRIHASSKEITCCFALRWSFLEKKQVRERRADIMLENFGFLGRFRARPYHCMVAIPYNRDACAERSIPGQELHQHHGPTSRLQPSR